MKDLQGGHHVKGSQAAVARAVSSRSALRDQTEPAVRTALGARSGADQVTVHSGGVQMATAAAPSVRDRRAMQAGPNDADQQIARAAPSVGIPPKSPRRDVPNLQCGMQPRDDAGRDRVGSRSSAHHAGTVQVLGEVRASVNAIAAKRLCNRIARRRSNTIRTKFSWGTSLSSSGPPARASRCRSPAQSNAGARSVICPTRARAAKREKATKREKAATDVKCARRASVSKRYFPAPVWDRAVKWKTGSAQGVSQ